MASVALKSLTSRKQREKWGTLTFLIEKWATRPLESVLLQLHFRYELGFKPPVIDGKRHKLKVEFSDSGRRLRSRSGRKVLLPTIAEPIVLVVETRGSASGDAAGCCRKPSKVIIEKERSGL